MYDFTTTTDRRHTGSIKWDAAPARVQEAGLTPLSIADMEFQVAPQIKRAAEKCNVFVRNGTILRLNGWRGER